MWKKHFNRNKSSDPTVKRELYKALLSLSLWIFYIGIGVDTLCMHHLEIPSIWVDTCQWRLSEHKVMCENQIWVSGK